MSKDGLILLLGQTGVGKSTFINDADPNNEPAVVSHDYFGSTSEVAGFNVESPANPSQRVTLVETPGFNDTWLKDIEILDKLIVWLKEQNPSVNVYAILYLHDITRYTPTLGAAAVTPSSLSRRELAKNVCLATVGWTGKDTPAHLVRQEQNLKTKSWNLMADAGSKIVRFEHTPESAWKILEDIMQTPPVSLNTFIHEMEMIRGGLERAPPGKVGPVAGFFSYLFGRGRR